MSFDRILDEMEIAAEPFAVCELRGRCDLGLGRQQQVTLHYVLAGRGEIALAGRRAIAVRAGSMVLVPAFWEHSLRAAGVGGVAPADCQPAELGLQHHRIEAPEGGDDRLLALCTRVDVGLRGARNLIDLVRQPLIEDVSLDAKMSRLIEQLVAEVAAPGLGSKAMIRVLLHECMIHLFRARMAADDGAMDWVRLLHDRSIWRPLEIMLESPGAAHSVDSLASAAGMSRSTFTRRFTEAYGDGPMALLRRLRVRMASSLLSESDLPIKRIAYLTGFQSRTAFSRAFIAATRLSPRAFRKKESPG